MAETKKLTVDYVLQQYINPNGTIMDRCEVARLYDDGKLEPCIQVPNPKLFYNFVSCGTYLFLLEAEPTRLCWKYDLNVSRWMECKKFPVAVSNTRMVYMNGKVYITGYDNGRGSFFYVYDFATDSYFDAYVTIAAVEHVASPFFVHQIAQLNELEIIYANSKVAYRINTRTWEMTRIETPKKLHELFKLVACHGRIYAIDYNDVQNVLKYEDGKWSTVEISYDGYLSVGHFKVHPKKNVVYLLEQHWKTQEYSVYSLDFDTKKIFEY